MSDAALATERAEQLQRIGVISQAFSPTAPINRAVLFAGRSEQIDRVISAVFQRGQHVIIFGERGVGKTSLANCLFDFLSQAGVQSMESGTINCDASMDFSSLWHKIFRDMSIKTPALQAAGFSAQPEEQHSSLEALVPERVTPDDVRHVLKTLPNKSMIIIDEMDRIGNKQETTTLLADTIKTLSDHSIDSTLILVGVADSVDELIHEHKSTERALAQIHMPRMSDPELIEILNKALVPAEITIDEDAKSKIVRLSKGLPHYTHLLGLHAALTAINTKRNAIIKADIIKAIEVALKEAQQSIISAYNLATTSPRENLYKQVLLACALVPPDELGTFSAADVRKPMSEIMKRTYDIPAFSQHLKAFCSEERGPILQRTGAKRRYRFRFINPLLQPFVIMRGINDGLIPQSALDTL
jgi:Cdc6-like AAA superfamily ATPase